jgi:hypothetical protein
MRVIIYYDRTLNALFIFRQKDMSVNCEWQANSGFTIFLLKNKIIFPNILKIQYSPPGEAKAINKVILTRSRVAKGVSYGPIRGIG